jgi:tetratricopeptide (TPR) repeat protein
LHKRIKPLEPPDSHHLRAALGWLELGNPVEANEELDKIASPLRVHPAVLAVRYEVHSKAKKWDAAADIASMQVKLTPEDPTAWIGLAYATRRKPGGGIPQAREILTQAQPKFPDQSLIPYNLACYECQLGNLKEAWHWLEKAFAVGDTKQMKQMALEDPDLQPLWKRISGI